MPAVLMNARTQSVVADTVELADTRKARRRGLLGRDSLDPRACLVLAPCFSIHTAGMRFPIDAMFINREGVVGRIVRDLVPWRIAICWSAHAVIEVAGGTLGVRDVRTGDRMYLTAVPVPTRSAISKLIHA